MRKNVGGLDRTARILVGVALIVATLVGWIGWWGWIGVVPLATGLVSFCPLYPLFGFSTCEGKGAKEDSLGAE